MAHFDIVQLPGVQESDYDFEFEAAYFSGTYFGNIYGQNGEHCFDAYLMDKPMDGDYFAAGTTAYLFDIFATAPGDSKNPRPAPGVYTLAALSAVFRAGRRVPALGSSTQGVSGPPIILMVKEE